MREYDSHFNSNEWFILIILFIAYFIVFILPRRFSLVISLASLFYAVIIGFLIDNTIGLPPFDLYDINDYSAYEFFDFLTYLMYGPFSYFIVYFYDMLRPKKYNILFYILIWSMVATGFEYLGILFGVYHYEKGWQLLYSFPSYVIINSFLIILYQKMYYTGKTHKENWNLRCDRC